MNTELSIRKQLESTGKELARLVSHLNYIDGLLHVSKWLTFLLYLAFTLSLYLGDILHLQSLITSFVGSAPGFVFYLVICVGLAYVLSGIKHAAYDHFSMFGMVAGIVAVVVSMGLLAEVFQSSGNQDTKARAITEGGSEYQALVNRNPAAGISTNTALIAGIAKAQATLARCEERKKAGKEKHCEGDRASLNALLDSQKADSAAKVQVATANTEAQFKRLDTLKQDAYNPTIRAIAEFSGVEIATGIVLIMLFIAAQFETLHWWLSQMKAKTLQAIAGIEGAIRRSEVDYYNLAGIEYDGQAHDQKPEPLPVIRTEQPKRADFGFIPSAPATAAYSTVIAPLFKYQGKDTGRKQSGFVGFVDTDNQPKARLQSNGTGKHSPILGTAEVQLSLPEVSTWNRELSGHGVDSPHDPAMNQTADKAAIQRIIAGAQQTAKTIRKPSAESATQTIRKPSAEGRVKPSADGLAGLYGEWLAAVARSECKPSVRDTWLWVQKRISGKETGESTDDRTRISAIQKALFDRAIEDGLMTLNPNYRNGGKKYLWTGRAAA